MITMFALLACCLILAANCLEFSRIKSLFRVNSRKFVADWKTAKVVIMNPACNPQRYRLRFTRDQEFQAPEKFREDAPENAKMMEMVNPPHPEIVLKELCLEPLRISVTDAAKALGVSRKTLSAVVNGRAGISPEMAIRLSLAFDTSPESWLNQQAQYDLWLARQKQHEIHVEKRYAGIPA